MISETKAASDSKLQRCVSVIPLKCISSLDSNRLGNYRSESTKRFNEHEHFIQTHFPIANIPQDRDGTISDKTFSSYQSPTVPKQAGTFLHRLVNKFLSMTNTNPKKNHRTQRQKKGNVQKDAYMTGKKRRQPPLKSTRKINRNYLSTFPLECLSSVMLNSNALKTPSISLSRISLEKSRTLNPSQCQTIASAVQLIFNTLISHYQSI